MKNKIKKGMAMIMMACMLLTVFGVSSEDGIMPCMEVVAGTSNLD